MSILKGIMNSCVSPLKITTAGAVKTADVLAKKVDLCFVATGLLKSPAADEFIASAGKQNAKILSDNFVRFGDDAIPVRVITKRLPSGTTVAKSFNIGGPQFKEVIKKNGAAFTYNAGGSAIGGKEIEVIKDYTAGKILYKPLFQPASKVFRTVPLEGSKFIDDVVGLTETSNKYNQEYLFFKKMRGID